tara:strand:+ start:705 stop:2519 length:1815 start_codon:yes stop_codon:yes gene_type:complete
MKYLTYIFIIFQFLLLGKSYSENISDIEENFLRWEILNNYKNFKKTNIKWEIVPKEKDSIKTYKDSKNYLYNYPKVDIDYTNRQKNYQEILEVLPHIPLNKYLDYGNFIFSTNWKSSFSGGAARGTGNQNISFKFDYGLSDDSLLSIYLSETDDPLYNLIEGKVIENNWASLALAYRKKIYESENNKNNISLAGSLEYWVVSSASGNTKSIYNEIDDSVGHDRHETFIYSFSLPLSTKINNKTNVSIVPGAIFIPEELGNKNIGDNFYGKNFFLGSGINFNLSNEVQLTGSYTYLFGPGYNYFNKDLDFKRKPIYSYGFNWDVSPIIGVEGKITNGYGSTPSTSLLTIPSDNKPLYYLGGSYKPFLTETTKFAPLSKNEELFLLGGLTVNNALIPERGTSQITLDYDEKGNAFAFYGYSLSNIFQFEIKTGSFNNIQLADNKNSALQNTYLDKNNINYRFGGKLSLLSLQKGDPFWTALRTTVGRNEGDNHQGYSFSELINTFKINDSVYLNINPKYFFSGIETIAGLGISAQIKLLNNLQLIPELNISFKNDQDLNSSIALRYFYSPKKSIDFYYSNAAGLQDLGQLIKDEEYKMGIRFNLFY